MNKINLIQFLLLIIIILVFVSIYQVFRCDNNNNESFRTVHYSSVNSRPLHGSSHQNYVRPHTYTNSYSRAYDYKPHYTNNTRVVATRGPTVINTHQVPYLQYVDKYNPVYIKTSPVNVTPTINTIDMNSVSSCSQLAHVLANSVDQGLITRDESINLWNSYKSKYC